MTIDERLFVGTSSGEHVEMYLKAMWLIKEDDEPIKVSTVARLLRIRQPCGTDDEKVGHDRLCKI